VPLTLVNPAALIGFGAVAVPFLIHLLRKREEVRVLFPATSLLAESATVLTRSRRLAELLLLAVRVLLIMALVAAFTRPRLRSAAIAPSGKVLAAAAFVIDESPSMGRRVNETGDVTCLGKARMAAAVFLGQLAPGSEAMLVTSSGVVFGPTSALGELGERIEALRVTDLAGDVPSAVAIARRDIAASAISRREVMVLSDLDRASWPGVKRASEVAAGRAGPGVIVVDVGPGRGRADVNVGITDLSARSTRLYAGVPFEIVATVRQVGGAREIRLKVSLSGRGVARAVREVTVPPGSSAQASFTTTIDQAGPAALTARIKPEGPAKSEGPLGFDDARFLALRVHEAVETVMISGEARGGGAATPARYIDAALRPGGARDERHFRVSELTPRELAAGEAPGAELLVVPGVRGWSANDWREVRRRIAAGAGAMVFLGEWAIEMDGRRASRPVLGEAAVSEARPAGAAGIEITAPEALARSFADGRNGRVETARFFRAMRAVWSDDSRFRPAGALSEGDGVMWHGTLGSGRLVVFGFEPRPEWTDLVRHPSWVPLVHEAAAWLARREGGAEPIPVGGPAAFSVERPGGAARWTFGPVGGEMISKGEIAASAPGGGTRRILAGRTTQRGFYELLVTEGKTGGLRMLLAANVDAAEGAFERIDAPARGARGSRGERGGRGGAAVRRTAEDALDEFRLGRFGRELTGLLAAIAVIMFAAETALIAYLASGEAKGGAA